MSTFLNRVLWLLKKPQLTRLNNGSLSVVHGQNHFAGMCSVSVPYLSRVFLRLTTTLLLLTMIGTETVFAKTLFKQTFGSNSGSATAWDANTYSIITGESDVYSGASQTVTDAKVSKNTMGNGTSSSALVSSQGNTGVYVVGPLDVEDCTSLALSNYFGMTSSSWANSSVMKCSYSTNGTAYTKLTRSDNNSPSKAVSSNANYVQATYTIPDSAYSSTLYLKFEFYCYQKNKNNQEIGQAYLDDVELTGTPAPSCTPLGAINGSVNLSHCFA